MMRISFLILVEFILFTLERKVTSFGFLRKKENPLVIIAKGCSKSVCSWYKSIFISNSNSYTNKYRIRTASLNFCSCCCISYFNSSFINLIGIKRFRTVKKYAVNRTIKNFHSTTTSNGEFVVIELPAHFGLEGGKDKKIKLSRDFIE
jgi:hypothetical protein